MTDLQTSADRIVNAASKTSSGMRARSSGSLSLGDVPSSALPSELSWVRTLMQPLFDLREEFVLNEGAVNSEVEAWLSTMRSTQEQWNTVDRAKSSMSSENSLTTDAFQSRVEGILSVLDAETQAAKAMVNALESQLDIAKSISTSIDNTITDGLAMFSNMGNELMPESGVGAMSPSSAAVAQVSEWVNSSVAAIERQIELASAEFQRGATSNANLAAAMNSLTSASDSTPNPSPLPAPTPPDDTGDSRNPDGRNGRRVENDKTTRRRSAGKGDFSNDWAGRAILGRYLSGGGDWNIDNDPNWTEYMENHESLSGDVQSLSEQMESYNDSQAVAAVEEYQRSGQKSGSFDTTSAVEIDNGEGIVGYQYLHGTNADAGGFKHSGTTSVRPLPDGNYEVTIDSTYQWNDIIDPNGDYRTDRVKNRVAEILTFGRADPYEIHIGWDDTSTVVVDADGNVISAEGWPYE
ncbi:hypothetical protein [Actinobaculum sp. 352]|uniref:hypothetical protein n=1 Tax=Actinobaculum sp. 352 TaxID=2490946 RepID=UPI000F7E7EE4|nr:hypothetical protein [Actinobaculum sp. 352]RTE50614.1 hypothetical protein EKN07_00170 [Actinobaculum sp. 352]